MKIKEQTRKLPTIKRIVSSFLIPDIMRFSDFKNFLPSLFLLIYSGLKIRYEQRD